MTEKNIFEKKKKKKKNEEIKWKIIYNISFPFFFASVKSSYIKGYC